MIFDEFVKDKDRNPPAPASEVDAFASHLNAILPPDYLAFLREANGSEGSVGRREKYLVLWPVGDIMRINADYHVQELAPHLLLFGSNGAGEAYAFKLTTNPVTVVSVPFIGMDEEVEWGSSFGEFLRRLALS
jgi:hypothetical protein